MLDIKGLLRRSGDGLLLELDLTQAISETVPSDPLGQVLNRKRSTLADILLGLKRAESDKNIKALVAKVGGPIPLAQTQEIRAAIQAFSQSGKPAFAWAATFGEMSPGTVAYYLASSFDEVWLQPSGDVCLTGLALQATFLRDLLDKLGVEPQIGQRWEYKNAANAFMESEFTEAHREATQALVFDIGEQMIEGIATSRSLSSALIRELMDKGVLSATEAQRSGLVDSIGYADEMYSHARKRCETEPELRFVSRYHHQAQRSERTGATLKKALSRGQQAVAIIHAEGAVRLGRSGRGPMGAAMGSETIQAAFSAATRNEQVKAIVFRIDSRGGSYVASDAIWRAATIAKESGKPLVVSMGNFAASGGYFMALPADVIFAQAGTITGSIGVLGGKQVIKGALARAGIGHDSISLASHSDMFSARKPFDHSEWEMLQSWLDRVYQDFTGRVATARNMEVGQVHEVARGRVWTGAQAKDRSLVDKIGGLLDAIDQAAELASLRSGGYQLLHFPHTNLLEQLRPAQSSESAGSSATAIAWSDTVGNLSQLTAQLGSTWAGPLSLDGSYGLT